jgi:hypothetical protein
MKMVGGERPRKKKNQKPVGGGGCYFVLPSGEHDRLVRDRFRFRVSCVSYKCVKLPLLFLCVLRATIYRKNIFWSLNFFLFL